MSQKLRIAVDAMGGDHGPEVIVEGALAAAREIDHEIILVGRQSRIRTIMRDLGMPPRRPRVFNAEETVTMKDSPKASLRKRKSSIAVAADLVKQGKADAVVSMGNTGACLATMVMKWRPLKSISRPALAQIIPVPEHPVLLLDVGANVDCRPQHLIDFALMGGIYAEEILGRPEPKIGVLSIGEEDTKGNELTLATLRALKRTDLNVLGNAEGRDIFSARFDVIVCDGFVGNVVLKFGEGLVEMIIENLKGEIGKNIASALAALALRPHFKTFKKQVAGDEFGAAPLLGVNGVCLVGHGSSGPGAVKSAIMQAARVAEHRVNEKILERAERVHTAAKTE